MSVLANAGKNIERLPAGRLRVLHPIRRNQGQPVMFCEVRELLVDPIFPAHKMALDLDEDVVATEDVDKKLRTICGTQGSRRDAETNTRDVCATQIRVRPEQSDKSLGILRQLIPLHRAASLLTAEMRLRQQLAQIFVTCPALHQHRQNASILHAQFGADNGPNILLPGRNRKTLRTVDSVPIEQGHRRHLEPGRGFR